MSISLAVMFVIVGAAAGTLSTSFGIGGGALSTPAIRALGISALDAIGTTLPSVLPGVVTGMLHYRKQHLIRYKLVWIVTIPGVFAAVFGSFFSHSLPGNGHLIMIITAAILLINAIRLAKTPKTNTSKHPPGWDLPMITEEGDLVGDMPDAYTYTKDNQDIPDPQDISVLALHKHLEGREVFRIGTIGIIAGLISGMLGLGGGIVLVPLFVHRLGLTVRESTATSLLCVGVLAVPSIIAHTLIGDINWPVSTLLAIGTVPGAHFGARAAARVSDKFFRTSAATVLSVVALIYGVSELSFFLK